MGERHTKLLIAGREVLIPTDVATRYVRMELALAPFAEIGRLLVEPYEGAEILIRRAPGFSYTIGLTAAHFVLAAGAVAPLPSKPHG